MGFVTAALCGMVLVQQAPAPQKIWPGFGVNIHGTEPGQSEINLLQAAGMDYVRTDFAWESTEKTAGNYDFSSYDKLLGRLKSAHIRPVFVLDYGNDIYERGAPKSVKAQDGYAKWAGAAVEHFKGEEIVWEIWNEPNVDSFWRPRADASAYSSLAVKAAKAMRAADATCRIIAPGASKVDKAFLRKVLTQELLSLIDGVSIHPYRSSGPETVYRDYLDMQALIQQIAPAGRENLPVICSEWGYSTYKGGDITEERQAMYVAKLWLLSAASGCPISIYYDWKDNGPIATNKEHRYGLVRSDLSMKPAFEAARLVLKAFKDCTVIKRMQKKDPLDWVIIGAGDGKLVRATWYQKVGGLPRFEAYDMSDRANRTLYNKIIEEANGTPAPKDPPKTNVTQPEPKTNTAPPIKRPDPKSPTPNVKTPLNIAFAPPIDSEGWCAVITKPTGLPAYKVEFNYARKETGAKVTCFATARNERTVEPLADTDPQTTILALVGGQKVGEFQVQKLDCPASAFELKSYRDGEATTTNPASTDLGGAVPYDFTDRIVGCGLKPKEKMEVPEGAKRLVIWIKSDNSNNLLSARLVDINGQVFSVDLGRLDAVADYNGWKAIVIAVADLPASTSGSGQSTPEGKLTWDSILWVEPGDKQNPKAGKIEFGPAAYEF